MSLPGTLKPDDCDVFILLAPKYHNESQIIVCMSSPDDCDTIARVSIFLAACNIVFIVFMRKLMQSSSGQTDIA
jgi:hypothetical protein